MKKYLKNSQKVVVNRFLKYKINSVILFNLKQREENLQKDLLFDVEKFVEDFNLKGVKLFVPKTYDLYSLAGASALYVYINEVCQIPTTLVADEKKIREVSDCLPEIEDPRTIKKNANDFLAIILDCASVADCDNNA